MKRTEADCVDALIRRFNFEKCRKAMAAVKWTWHGMPEPPSVEQMMYSVREKWDHMKDRPDVTYVYSGGLRLGRESRDGRKFLTLEFVLEEHDSEITAV